MSKNQGAMIGAVVGVVVGVVAFGLILRGILGERDSQAQLEAQIEPMALALEGSKPRETPDPGVLPTRQVELATVQAQLATAQAKLVAAQFAFPSEVDSTEVLAHVVTTAAIHDVILRQVKAREPVSATLGSSTPGSSSYRLFAYDVEVEGTLEAISIFLAALEDGPIESLSLDQVRLQAQATPRPPTAQGSIISTPVVAPVIYRSSLVIHVYVRPVASGSTPLPPASTPASPEEHVREMEMLLAQARLEQDWDRAISLLLVLRDLRPDNPALKAELVDVYVRDGRQRLAAGQYDQAAADFRAALTLQPDNNEALVGLTALAALTPVPALTLTALHAPPTPTETPTETPTPTPSATPTITPTPLPYFVAHMVFSENTRYPDLGCSWFGFAGRVSNPSGYPLSGIRMRVWAPGWPGVWTETLPSGEYEQYLDDHPRQQRWLVQLYEGDTPASEVITVDSRAECSATLIQMDWQRGY